MEERLEILRNVLPTGLISESISSLAVTLGYKSRATLYRIMDGTASTNAVNDFYRKAESTLFLSEDTLYNISTTIENTAGFNRLMKAETDNFRTIDPFDVLKAFISHDYSIFSTDFTSHELPGLQRLELTDPSAFFTMLAFFYFKALRVDFYERSKSYRERCAELMEWVGRRLIELYPANGIAAETVHVYSRSEILDAEAPILWNFITTLATLLQYYGTPDIGKLVAKDFLLVPFLPDRSYWRTDSSSDLILMRAMKHNLPGSGYYEIFLIPPDTGTVENIGVISFLSDEILSYRDKNTGITRMGMFQIDEENLLFTRENGKESPFGTGDHWKRQSLRHSQSLRTLDKHLSENYLNECALSADGFKSVPGYSVTNVNLSRNGVRLSLDNGRIYEISYSTAPFLEYILPSNDVIVAEQMESGEIFVSWPQLMHCIPLRLFTRVR